MEKLAIDETPNTWNRYALTYDGTTFKVYSNGVQKWSTSGCTMPNDKLCIGGIIDYPNAAGGTDRGFFNGTYRNIKVYSYALDASQL